ncbi:MAG: hydantoinase B/oxoprolinase family protein, partial [Planctomycetales bacterium]|nr:hydantoinase B/oxoprolinase family protein [Planctomycetales bacterium]
MTHQRTDRNWRFWIDVGGTFTDCLAISPSGQQCAAKVLSSGKTKGLVGHDSDVDRIVDPRRCDDHAEFWNGYQLHLFDEQGSRIGQSRVRQFDARQGTLWLTRPLATVPDVGCRYELVSPEPSPLLAVRQVLGARLEQPLPALDLRLGTTRGTNALLTRTGAHTALVTTAGFGDVLEIGYQNRPQLFALDIVKPPALYCCVVEVPERIAHDGQVLVPLDLDRLRDQLQVLQDLQIESVAVCLLHGFAWPQHEQMIGQVLREMGIMEVSLSHQVAPLMKLVPRGDTTVADAYLTPVLRGYREELRPRAGDGQRTLRLMTSAGGLVEASHFRGCESILSGPAGGVVGFSKVASAAGFATAIGFDMGGTSTDVSRFDGDFDLEFETEKGGVRVMSPMLAIETVAAGGGSICRFDGVKLTVGPESSGADPGPACYGRGGPLSVTDVNLALGRVLEDHFPFPLDLPAVHHRLQQAVLQIHQATGQRLSWQQVATGFRDIANANIVRAIRSISVAKGYDPRNDCLVPFGGAAGQHACAVAEQLGIRQILCHPHAGLLSAWGIGHATIHRHEVQGIYQCYNEVRHELQQRFEQLEQSAAEELTRQGIPREHISCARSMELRYMGTEATLHIRLPRNHQGIDTSRDTHDVHIDGDIDIVNLFEHEHEQRFGYLDRHRRIEVVAIRVEAMDSQQQLLPQSRRLPVSDPTVAEMVEMIIEGNARSVPFFARGDLVAGNVLAGPAIICESASTTVIDSGWQGLVLSDGQLLLEQLGVKASPPATTLTAVDPIMLEIFSNSFGEIAQQMGIALRATAQSVNVKERLDFSCAVFTARGELVVNAPHIPVHLGAMGQTIQSLIAERSPLHRGDVFVTNDPYAGGSHLPDVTVITPVFGDDDSLLFFTASRAHHAEIGGIVPGSMPPFSKSLAEEGVLLHHEPLIAAGEPRFDALREQLTGSPYPSRSPDTNIADIQAQIAANRQGASGLLQLINRYGRNTVLAYMNHIQQAAEFKTRQLFASIPDGVYQRCDHLDDGTPIGVTITISGEQATFDFGGSGAVHAG